ncbi:hypothetical protein I4U23_019800 [Adineta vaga]|nr:hypothetical protein I4U23_019800 [Adineta vaga]
MCKNRNYKIRRQNLYRMSTYPIQFLQGHIIASIDQFDYLIDTGSPKSFGHKTNIYINGKNFPIRDDGPGTTIDTLCSLSGLKFDGLIGMDILKHFDIQFTQNDIHFSDTSIPYTELAIKLPIIDTIMTIPIIKLNVGQVDQRIIFDTGAKLSYLSDDLLVGTSVGEMEDFYPTIGIYKTNVYKIEVIMNGNTETLTFGSLPSSINILLEMGQTKGIIGTELLNKYTIILSNSDKMLILEPNISD